MKSKFKIVILVLFFSPFFTFSLNETEILDKIDVIDEIASDVYGPTDNRSIEEEFKETITERFNVLENANQLSSWQGQISHLLIVIENKLLSQFGSLSVVTNRSRLGNTTISVKSTSEEYNRAEQLLKKIMNFTKWLIPLILVIVIFIDIIKFLSGKKSELNTLLIKYILIISLNFCQIYISALLFEVHTYLSTIVTSIFSQELIDADENFHDALKEKELYENVDIDEKKNPMEIYEEMLLKSVEETSEGGFLFSKISVEAFFSKIAVYAYFFIMRLLLIVYDIASFFVSMFSKFLVTLTILFFPLSLCLSFIPTLEKSWSKLIRYYISFNMWLVVAGVIKSFGKMMLLEKLISKSSALVDCIGSSEYTSFSLSDHLDIGSIIQLVIVIMFIIIVPKLSDMLIEGASSGAFFSGLTATATAGATKALSVGAGVAQRASNLY